MTSEQRERAIGILTAGMSARDIVRHFQRHEPTVSRLLNRFQQTVKVADRPRSGRPRKTTPREDRFLPISSRRNRFLSSRKLGRLLRNASGTRVCDRTVRNRLHAARLKACRPYVGIPLTPVYTLRNITITFYAFITSMCCSGLQDHWISLPLSTYGTT